MPTTRPTARPTRWGAWMMTPWIASCATGSPGLRAECAIAKPILVSLDDVLTPGTARQILAYDRTVTRLCGP